MLHFAAGFWWLIFPLGGALGTGLRAIAVANERRAERRMERYRLKQQTKIAVAQAIRRRRSDFSEDDQQRLARAQHLLHLAQDEAATREERQIAYARASKELDGLIVLPTPARASIERRIAGAIEA